MQMQMQMREGVEVEEKTAVKVEEKRGGKRKRDDVVEVELLSC